MTMIIIILGFGLCYLKAFNCVIRKAVGNRQAVDHLNLFSEVEYLVSFR